LGSWYHFKKILEQLLNGPTPGYATGGQDTVEISSYKTKNVRSPEKNFK
jgi:hypothetical protein